MKAKTAFENTFKLFLLILVILLPLSLVGIASSFGELAGLGLFWDKGHITSSQSLETFIMHSGGLDFILAGVVGFFAMVGYYYFCRMSADMLFPRIDSSVFQILMIAYFILGAYAMSQGYLDKAIYQVADLLYAYEASVPPHVVEWKMLIFSIPSLVAAVAYIVFYLRAEQTEV